MSDWTLLCNVLRMIKWADFFPYILKKTNFSFLWKKILFFFTLMNSFLFRFCSPNSFIALTITIAVCLQCSSVFIQSGLLLPTSDWLITDWRLILDCCIWQKMFLIFFVSQVLVSSFVILWQSFRNNCVCYLCQHVSSIPISNSVWSSQLLWLVSRV